jgi:hypothetical protein
MVVSGICISQLKLDDTNKKRVCKINEKHKSLGRNTDKGESKQTHVIHEELAIPCSSERTGLRRTGRMKIVPQLCLNLPTSVKVTDGLALSRTQSLEKV